MTLPEAGPNSWLARIAVAIFSAARTEVLSSLVINTLTPPTVTVPWAGTPAKVMVCRSPTVMPVVAAFRLMAAAYAIALPAELFTGEYGSSSAYEAPISTPLI